MGITFDPLSEDRYDRQRLISWWDQPRLSAARVLVAGAGALGNEALKLLALTGVGQIVVIDFDVVSPSNLARTVLFRAEDVGRPKVEAAAGRLRQINPEISVQTIQGDLRLDLGLGEIRRVDAVLGCLDSVHARWALNRKCLQAGVEWIDAGISDFHGQVARYSPHSGACYECTFTQATYERFERRYSCPSGLRSRQPENKVPTTAVTASLTAALQVQQLLLLLHGREGGLAAGQRMSVYLEPYRMTIDALPPNPDCLAHDPLPADLPGLEYDPRRTRIAELLERARAVLTGARTLELPYDLVVEFNCPSCGNVDKLLQPKEKIYQDQAACPTCGALRSPQIISSVSTGSPWAACTLGDLGLPAREILAFNNDYTKQYIQLIPFDDD